MFYLIFFSLSLYFISVVAFLSFSILCIYYVCVCVWYEFTLLVHANFGHVVMFYCCDTHSHTSTLYRYMYHLLFCSFFFLFYFAHRFYWRTKDDGKFSFNTSHIPRKIFAFFFCLSIIWSSFDVSHTISFHWMKYWKNIFQIRKRVHFCNIFARIQFMHSHYNQKFHSNETKTRQKKHKMMLLGLRDKNRQVERVWVVCAWDTQHTYTRTHIDETIDQGIYNIWEVQCERENFKCWCLIDCICWTVFFSFLLRHFGRSRDS